MIRSDHPAPVDSEVRGLIADPSAPTRGDTQVADGVLNVRRRQAAPMQVGGGKLPRLVARARPTAKVPPKLGTKAKSSCLRSTFRGADSSRSRCAMRSRPTLRLA